MSPREEHAKRVAEFDEATDVDTKCRILLAYASFATGSVEALLSRVDALEYRVKELEDETASTPPRGSPGVNALHATKRQPGDV